MSDLALCRQYFGDVEVRYFHLAALFAVVLHGTRLFAPAVRFLNRLDRALLRTPLRRHAWVTILELARPKRNG